MRSAPGGLRGRLMSYFEEEENWDYMLERPDSFASEDNLLIRVRELDGPIMQAGKTRNLDLLPSLWQLRRTHDKHALRSAILHKGQLGKVRLSEGTTVAVPWRWTVEGERSVTE